MSPSCIKRMELANLGSWVYTQRRLKKRKTLDSDRQKILEDIGFKWVLVEYRSHVLWWEERFDLLKELKKCEGGCNVLKSHKEGAASLGRWVDEPQKPKRTNKLDTDGQKILQDVGFLSSFPALGPLVPGPSRCM